MKQAGKLALAGLLVLSWVAPLLAQKEVNPPAIPPMLEGQRPLAHSESQDPESSPAEVDKSTAGGKVKAEKKGKKTAAVAGARKKGKTNALGKKKATKAGKKKGTAKVKPAGEKNT